MKTQAVMLFSSADFDRALMGDLLKANRWHVHTPVTGKEALRSLDRDCPNLVILDAAMPEREWRPLATACSNKGVRMLVVDPKDRPAPGVTEQERVCRPLDTTLFTRRVFEMMQDRPVGRGIADSSEA